MSIPRELGSPPPPLKQALMIGFSKCFDVYQLVSELVFVFTEKWESWMKCKRVSHWDVSSQRQCYDRGLTIAECVNPKFSMRCWVEC